MMNNMFSMFDPSTNMGALNWVSLVLPATLMTCKMYKQKSRTMTLINTSLKMMMNNISTNIKPTFIKNSLIMIAMFTFTATSNLISLSPFIFTPTSHMTTSLMMSLPLWLAITMKSWVVNTQQTMTHLTPKGTPIPLAPLMVIIETISTIIRPLTLSIRLSANMIAGHILIALASSTLNWGPISLPMTYPLISSLILLEMSVAAIQAYVLTTLISLYMNEVSN